MTTIAYRDGVMASDSGCWHGDALHPWAQKLLRGPDGTLYGGLGSAAAVNTFFEWVEGGSVGPMPTPTRLDDDRSTFQVLIVPPSGRAKALNHDGYEHFGGPYVAVGAGAPTVYGALFMGATAEQAIEAALMHGSGAVGLVQSIRPGGG